MEELSAEDMERRREEALKFGLAILGAELADRPTPGSPLAEVEQLEEALKQGLITDDEFSAAVGRVVDASVARLRAEGKAL